MSCGFGFAALFPHWANIVQGRAGGQALWLPSSPHLAKRDVIELRGFSRATPRLLTLLLQGLATTDSLDRRGG